MSSTAHSYRRKIDPRVRHDLDRGELAGGVEVLLRTEHAMTPAEQQELRDAGCHFRLTVGNLATGVVEHAGDLEAVARLPFVRRIELSRRLYAEAL